MGEFKEKGAEALLEVKHLSKMCGERAVLTDVTFSVPKGGIHGILGPSGSGKSMLMELLSGSISADAGSILLSGKAVNTEARSVKSKIGYMPQRSPFYQNMTVGETLDFVGDARGVPSEKRYRQIKEALDLVGLAEREKRLVKRLNGEEQKRLSLAASLLGNPEILLLDEPIPKADVGKQDEFFGILRMLGRVKTVLLAVPDLESAQMLCEDVIILSDGKILVQETFSALDAKLQSSGEAQSLADLYRALVSVSVQPIGDWGGSDAVKKKKREKTKGDHK